MAYTQNLVEKQQRFLSSGTFTPSAAHLAAGGWINLFMVGGGGGGSNGYVTSVGGGGGSVISNFIVQLSGTCTVTIGAGGAGGAQNAFTGLNPGSAGGQSRLYLASAVTTLGVAITSTTATTFTATSGAAITNGSVILIDSEEMLVTGIAANVVTVTRGYRNTVAATHLISTSIYASYLTALGGAGGSSTAPFGASGGTISSAPGSYSTPAGCGGGGGGAGGVPTTIYVLQTTSTNAYFPTQWSGGPGLYGYGAGGSQNIYPVTYPNAFIPAQNGVAAPNKAGVNQPASTANTGAGGTGGYGDTLTGWAGGAGGSGICIITYSE